jgi:hypothetical protein
MVPFVGLRRPFSSQAERMHEEIMKKKSKVAADQPMGIVIATGRAAENAPRVRAYFWFEEPNTGSDEAEK